MTTPPFPSSWQVPAHRVDVLAPRTHALALVIPVINEGERILAQLAAIQKAAPMVDVVVADGGSDDGSMEVGRLAALGVGALITKTGPGKLSAQLRCGYAHALRSGYEGILTMDGNGKDGVDGIQRIAERLLDGADYVQGSRYAQGGEAVRTPAERAFANRLVHAPLMSWAGGVRLTDTTNGFRGYSRRFLDDPRVLPFRDVFVRYELLFYLTVRAGQLGMRVEEVGVTRAYPEAGPTPTKINGWKGKWDVLRQTLDAARGRFSP